MNKVTSLVICETATILKMTEQQEVFSNPLAPPGSGTQHDEDDHKPLRNEDFRKLLLETPRAPTRDTSSHSFHKPKQEKKPSAESEDAAARRQKRKSYYAKLKKAEEERAKELASRYRDRASERRDGVNPDYKQEDAISTTANYRAVAPDAKTGADAAERRRQIIQESKFLGGDMEHTHLVKGLDYALLEKVRSEIQSKEVEEDELETMLKKEKKEEDREKIECKNQIAKKIVSLLFEGGEPDAATSERNELFLPGRMAYKIEIDDEYSDTDIPSTIIRSKADLPNVETQTTLSTNDIVINKLTQILAYLRQGVRQGKKSKKRDKGKLKEEMKKLAGADENIYDDIGSAYIPKLKHTELKSAAGVGGSSGGSSSKQRQAVGGSSRDKSAAGGSSSTGGSRGSYFDKSLAAEVGVERKAAEDPKESIKQLVKNINERYGSGGGGGGGGGDATTAGLRMTEDQIAKKKAEKLRRLIQPSGYEECYPGAMAAEDAVIDSDDEADFSKMDVGKKGAVGRWDFDTQEEYSDYMSHKEALPKAAFQYGVKMSDGRKTRRLGKDHQKDEKAELDREWQKIQKIISKQHGGGDDSGVSQYKKPKLY